MSLLTPIPATDQSAETAKIRKNSVKLSETLQSFGVDVTVKQATLSEHYPIRDSTCDWRQGFQNHQPGR